MDAVGRFRHLRGNRDTDDNGGAQITQRAGQCLDQLLRIGKRVGGTHRDDHGAQHQSLGGAHQQPLRIDRAEHIDARRPLRKVDGGDAEQFLLADLGADEDVHDHAVDHDPPAENEIDGEGPGPGGGTPTLRNHETQDDQRHGQDVEVGGQADGPGDTQGPHPPGHGVDQTPGQEITLDCLHCVSHFSTMWPPRWEAATGRVTRGLPHDAAPRWRRPPRRTGR